MVQYQAWCLRQLFCNHGLLDHRVAPVTMDAMTERDALFKIAWLHRQMLDHDDRLVCAECSTDEQPRWYPCETRLVCDAVFSGPGVTYTTADGWPDTLPGVTV